MKQYTLHKAERLKKRKDIDLLFKKGSSFSIYPLRLYYLTTAIAADKGEHSVLQFGVSVSKKNFKKAVHRNRIKRLVREAYRTQKLPLQQQVKANGRLALKLFVIYTGKELPDYNLIKAKVSSALARLEKDALKMPI